MSSLFGSIGEHHRLPGLCYGYSGRKVASNMFTSLMGRELAGEGILTVTIDPGWVQTDMGGKHAPQTAEETVAGMRRVIEALTPETTGQFVSWLGQPVGW
jgi:NAD(P)-dependent dehydrogenase (short-subunit alcohol dehydrogenase family)